MLPDSFLFFFRTFFLFRKVFPFFRMLPISSLFFRAFFLFQKTFLSDSSEILSLFSDSSGPPSLFSSSFSLSLGLISLSIPFGAFWGAFRAGHFLWRDEQVKRERGRPSRLPQEGVEWGEDYPNMPPPPSSWPVPGSSVEPVSLL